VEQPPISPRPKKLPVSAILFGILAGVVGVAAGLGLGLALGSVLASAFHVSSMEGEAGYFAVAIALIVALIVTPTSILLTLYWRGVRTIWLFIGLIAVCLSIFAITAAGFGLWYVRQPHILSLADVEPELDTDRNPMPMPGYWHTDAAENSGVRAGYVELYFRTSQRHFVLKFPGREDRIFRLQLPANPMSTRYRTWSDWKKPDFVAKAGEQPSRPSGGNEYQIRYKVDYQER